MREKWIDRAWFAFWFIASSLWILTAAQQVGTTFDEPVYFTGGLQFWRHGSHHDLLRLGTMPLPMDLATLPVYLYERFTGVEVSLTGAEFPEVHFWCRSTVLVFWLVLLTFARIIGRSLGGPWAGRLAVAFLACEPNFLAHAALATADIALAALLLPAIHYFGVHRDGSWRWRVLLPGLLFGLCLLAKASAIMFAPLGMFVVELFRLHRANAFALSADGLWRRFTIPIRPFIRDMVGISFIGFTVMFVYCGSDWQAERSWISWARTLPEGSFKGAMLYLAENLRVFNNAGVGIVKQIGHNIRGHGVYMLGATDPRALWYYFPVAVSIKTTLPILFLPLLLLVVHRRSLLNWACLLAGALFLYSVQCRVQIGIRLMLPWIAIGIVGLSAAVVRGWEDCGAAWRKQALLGYCGAGILWNAVAVVTIWPHGLCYINELWGGPREGYTLISDSNYDWGQGVPELERWLAVHDSPPTHLWYFGADPKADQLTADRRQYHKSDKDAFLKDVRGHYLAVGTTIMYGSYVQTDITRMLRQMQPASRTQTFLIYDFTRPTAIASK